MMGFLTGGNTFTVWWISNDVDLVIQTDIHRDHVGLGVEIPKLKR